MQLFGAPSLLRVRLLALAVAAGIPAVLLVVPGASVGPVQGTRSAPPHGSGGQISEGHGLIGKLKSSSVSASPPGSGQFHARSKFVPSVSATSSPNGATSTPGPRATPTPTPSALPPARRAVVSSGVRGRNSSSPVSPTTSRE